MVEEIAGLVERSGQHTDRVHSPDYMPGHRRSLETDRWQWRTAG
jgi:hypothetical protein